MATRTASAVGGYDELASVYDAFTAGSDYETWTRHVLALLGVYGWRGTTVLDVACGTGKSFIPLVNRGFAVTGCDSSGAMLAEAARKAPGVPLVEADMRELPQLGAFELVTCFDDSLNHLLDEADLQAALRSMAANLHERGLLVFDLNTLLAYRTTFAVDRISRSGDTLFAWSGHSAHDAAPGCRATARIDAFVPVGDALHRRISSCHEQRHFPPELVVDLLIEAGLECLGVHGVRNDGSHTPAVDEAQHLKVMFVARLAKGGDPE